MNRKTRILLICCLALCSLNAAHANSSWIWISRTRPVDVLPWVAIATVLFEWLLLVRFAGLRRRGKALGVVALANLASFAVPYAVHYLCCGIDGLDFSRFLDHWPIYTIGIAFVIATIAIELPVVYAGLKRDAPDRKRFVCVVIVANVLTTALVAVAERLFCRGHW